jgi:signal transduction histidine kinase
LEVNMGVASVIPASTLLAPACEAEPASLDCAHPQVAYLRALQEISRKLRSDLDLESVLNNTLDEAMRALGAKRGCLFAVDPATDELELRVSRRLDASNLTSKAFRPSRTVIERVWCQGKPFLSVNAAEDPTLTKADSVIRGSLRSLLCVPLHVQGQRIGVLYLDNPLKVGQFQEGDLALAVDIADQAALALHTAQMHARECQTAIERERHRLAHELHDGVNQYLYSIGMAAQAVLKLLDQADIDGQTRNLVQEIHAMSQVALADIREKLYDLHPTSLGNRKLTDTLTKHCEMLRSQYALDVKLVTDQELALSPCQREALFYVAREAMWNIIRHANASRVEILLGRQNEDALLCIADNGVGFDSAALGLEETMGLSTMRERLQVVKGTLELESGPGGGTQVTARIPIE